MSSISRLSLSATLLAALCTLGLGAGATACSDNKKDPVARADRDRDGLEDAVEGTLGTDPDNQDSDGDGRGDGIEVGVDPTMPADHDSDGTIDALDPCYPDPSVNACDNGGDPDGGTDGGDGGPDQICTPGEIIACLNAETAQRCNDEGTAFIDRRCGTGLACVNKECIAVPCTPNQRVCRGDKIYLCGDEGVADELIENCDLENTGRACSLGACIPVCDTELIKGTSEGCEYWAVDLDNAFVPSGGGNFIDAGGQQFAVVVSNPSQVPAEIRVCNHESRLACNKPADRPEDAVPVIDTMVPPGELVVLNLPRADAQGTRLDKIAFFITSSVPINAYQFNPLDNQVQVFSNDASLLLPVSALGNEYLVMTRRQQFAELKGYVTVVGVRAGGTRVKVTVTAKTLPGPGLPAMEPGDHICRTLYPYDVLNIETNQVGADLTGTEVLADRPVAVFGGSEAADAPNRDNPPDPSSPERVCCADHLEQQMFPVSTWGREYLAAKSFDRGDEPDVWRVMALEDETALDIWITGRDRPEIAPTLRKRGEWYEFESRFDFELLATKPVLVGQFLAAEYATGTDCGGQCNPDFQECRCRQNQQGVQVCRPAHCIGDPAFILLSPAEQFRKRHVVLAPDAYELDFINIVAPAGIQVSLDGEVIENSEFTPVGRGAFEVVKIPIEDGVHTVEAEEPVGVTVYGYDQFVSYGYPGGLNLLELRPVRQLPTLDGEPPQGSCPDD